MVVFVDLPQQLTNLEMRLVIICEMLLATAHGNAAIGALVADMGGRHRTHLSALSVVR